MKVFGVSVKDAVEHWMEAAHELGKLETVKAKLQAQIVGEQQTYVTQADVLATRNKWINVVRSIRAAPQGRRRRRHRDRHLMAPLRREEAKAARGGATPPADPIADPTGAPSRPSLRTVQRRPVTDDARHSPWLTKDGRGELFILGDSPRRFFARASCTLPTKFASQRILSRARCRS